MPRVPRRRPPAAALVLLAAALAALLAAYGRAPVVSDALAATTTLSFAATADAYVDQAKPTSNFGTATTLTADAGAGVAKNAYLRFQVSGVTGTVVSAKVHLYVNNGSGNGPAIYPTGDLWTETGLTWSNQPGATGAATDDKGSVAASAFVDYDVTPLVTGDGAYDFVLVTPSTDALGVNSREAAANTPSLEIVTDSGATTTDSTPPDTTISSGPAASTTDTSASFAFSSPDTDTTGYECSLDGAAFAACTSPAPYTALTATQHTFQVRAKDGAGNVDPTPASQTWTITTAATGSTLTFADTADAYVDQAAPGSNYSASTALKVHGGAGVARNSYLRFAVSGLTGTVVSATVHVYVTDGSPNGPAIYPTGGLWTETGLTWANQPGPTGAATDDKAAVTRGTWLDYDVTSLVGADGTYNFELVQPSTDGTALSSREASTNRPTLEIVTGSGGPTTDTTPPDTTIGSGPPTSTTDTSASFAFSSPDTDTTGFECSLDGATFAACTSPKAYTGLAARQHTFQVRAKDAAGNVDLTPASQTWTITTPITKAATPTGLTATGATGQIALTWNASTGATSYNVYRSTTSTISSTPYKTQITGTSLTDSGLPASTTYYYAISAVNSAGESAPSNPPVQATTAADPQAGLVALWHMDERSGTSMFDSVGNHTGTLHSVTLGQTGFSSFAFGFNGSSSYVSVLNTSDLVPGSKDITLTLHMKTTVRPPSTVEDWDLMRKGLYTSGSEFKMEYYPSGQVGCAFLGSLAYTGEHPVGPTLNNGQWHTIQCVKTATGMKTIVDGQTVYTQTVLIGSITTTDSIAIGARPGSEYFQGSLDEVSIKYG